MKIIYVTLNHADEARKIAHLLLKQKLTNCVNFFPITCIYNYQDQITEEPEVVLIIKTQDDKYNQIQELIKAQINYDNFIGQLNVDKINSNFEEWLSSIVK